MATTVTIDGTGYPLPSAGSTGWASIIGRFFSALGSNLGPSVLHFGSATTPANTATNYLRPGFVAAAADTVAVNVRVPFTGVASKLYLQATTGPVTSGQTVTVMKNGVATALTASLAAAGTQGADTTHSFSVTAGDYLSVKVVGAASIATGAINLVASFRITNQ